VPAKLADPDFGSALRSTSSTLVARAGFVDHVPSTVRALLDRLHPTPAVVIGPWYQIRAYNRAFEVVMRPIGVLDNSDPNLARFTFLDSRAHTVFP
jgi:hypothetical protein